MRERKHENVFQTIKSEESNKGEAIPDLQIETPSPIYNDIPLLTDVHQNVTKIGEEVEQPLTSEGKMKCTECDLLFFIRREYMQHMKQHNIVSVCKICGRQVLSSNYRRHLEVHKSSPKVCELCGAVAKNTESLRGHIFYMHKSTAEQYKCKICDKFFRYKYKFKLHQRKAHGGDRSHICEVCGKAFFTARDVKRHVQMTHMKLRPFLCQFCNKAFSSSYARNTHVRQHTNERPFKCEICAEGFKQRVSLKTHMKSKHGFMPMPSSGQSFLESKNLKSEITEVIILKPR